jgi:hypothetical protein
MASFAWCERHGPKLETRSKGTTVAPGETKSETLPHLDGLEPEQEKRPGRR